MDSRRAAVAVGIVLSAVAAAPGEDAPSHEDLSHWQWFTDVAAPADAAGRFDGLLGPEVFDKAREDLGDLRLIDGNGREIPYALRVRRSRVAPEVIPTTAFNQARNADGSAESSFDLGPKPPENRSLTVEPDGANYRRRARVEGSDDRDHWRTLLDNGQLVSLRVGDQAIDARTLTYPASRFRYLRVIVSPDKAGDDKPDPPRVQVFKAVEKEGEDATAPVAISPREPVPTPDGPGSVWYLTVRDRNGVDLTTFWERLRFEADNPEFSRPYFVEWADPEWPVHRLTAGQWVRAPGDPGPEAAFSEVRAKRLRLVVTDNRSPPLLLRSATSTTAARELVFNLSDGWAPPLRLYFGDPTAPAGRYDDYVAALPVVLDPPPTRVTLGTAHLTAPERNPAYREPPKPFTEQFPWLIYVVLSLAGLTLLAILLYLARRAMDQADAGEAGRAAGMIPAGGPKPPG